MIIANDMALITFLPLSYLVLSGAKSNKYMAFTFIMQNIAANLGGMLTPFGNPQNLYLYTKFNIPNGEFVGIMFLPFIVSIALITVCCMFIKKEPLETEDDEVKLPVGKSILYCILFTLSVAIVFRGIHYGVGLVVIPTVLFFVDRKALKMVDYPLLLTFCAFFIFSGNMSRIGIIRDIFDFLLGKSTLLFSILSCQIISNVPSAILLSQFTDNYRDLLIGVNIGGIGTIIASLASLITFSEYKRHNPDKSRSYIQMFSVINFTFLILITFICVVLR
jgi:Na+/H+ antiporter NhaD/arsenite permease-like protein